jgi:hypothetical protein
MDTKMSLSNIKWLANIASGEMTSKCRIYLSEHGPRIAFAID